MVIYFVCFFIAVCKEKEHSGTFQSVINILLTKNNLHSIVMEGFTPPSLDSLLGSLNSEKIIDNVGEVSSDELSHDGEADLDVSANFAWLYWFR